MLQQRSILQANRRHHLTEQLAHMNRGEHLCLIYDSEDEQMNILASYIEATLSRNEAFIYIASDHSQAELKKLLTERGVDVEREFERGALKLLTKREAYLRDNHFDPEKMIALWKALAQDAIRAGFKGLQATGEMTWALGSECGCERLVEYEALLNDEFPKLEVSAICQYDRRRFSSEILHNILRTHPLAVINGKVCKNLFYEAPKLVVEQRSLDERLSWMLDRLHEYHEAQLAQARSIQSLRESEAFRTRMIENSLDCILVLDRGANLLSVNEGGCKLMGISPGLLPSILNTSWFKLWPEEMVPEVKAAIEKAAQGGRGHFAGQCIGYDGSVRWWDVVVTLIDAGSSDKFLAISRDITELKQKEAELRTAVDAREEFLSVASHELKTPLTALQLQADALRHKLEKVQSGSLEPQLVNSFVSSIDKQAKCLNRLVDDMLDMSRIERGSLKVRKESVNLSNLLLEIVESFGEQFKAGGCKYRLAIESDIWVDCDAFRLQQAITNLLSNAIKYGARRPIQISLESSDGQCSIGVADEGMGISPDDMERIFDRFERAVPSVHISGLGLGLFIAREIVQAHEGKLVVESAINEGSKFRIILPVISDTHLARAKNDRADPRWHVIRSG